MKIFKYATTLALMIAATAGIVKAARVVYSQTLVSETALAFNNTYTLDMGASYLSHSNIDSVSMQAVYSTATIPSVTFTDGVKSTATITITNFNGLVGVAATNTLTVKSTTTIANLGVSFTLNGIKFVYGDLWSVGASTAATAISIANAINSYGATSPLVVASTTSAGVVTLTAVNVGAAANAFTLVSSSVAALTAGGATFTSGVNQGFIVINGVTLTQGTDFTAATSSAATASSIASAIKGNGSLSAVITVSTAASPGGVDTLTSASVGSNTNYSLWSSTPAAVSTPNRGFFGGTDSAINVATDKITVTNHKLTTGLQVLLTKSAGTIPTGLTVNTTYYAIRNDANNFQLASSLANAQAGTKIDITAITGSGTFNVAPLAIAGTPTFKWQSSVDNSNWSDVSASSVTFSSPYAASSTVWDFGTVNYRYLRLNVVAPTQGGLNLVVTGSGKSSN